MYFFEPFLRFQKINWCISYAYLIRRRVSERTRSIIALDQKSSLCASCSIYYVRTRGSNEKHLFSICFLEHIALQKNNSDTRYAEWWRSTARRAGTGNRSGLPLPGHEVELDRAGPCTCNCIVMPAFRYFFFSIFFGKYQIHRKFSYDSWKNILNVTLLADNKTHTDP